MATVYTQVSLRKRSPPNRKKWAMLKKKEDQFVRETGILVKND
jgi:hypothetical protein